MLSDKDKELRKTGLGGTDVASLVEGKALAVYRTKVEGYEQPANDAMNRGQRFEPVVREMYRDATGAELLGGGFLRHKSKPYFLANLDERARRDGQEGVAEFKTVGHWAQERWESDVPQRALVQVSWYLGLADLPWADVAALMPDYQLKIYRVDFDAELFNMLCTLAEDFWKSSVLAKIPPPPDASAEASEWLAERYPRNVRDDVEPTPEALVIARKVLTARTILADAEKVIDLGTNQLKALCGDHAGIKGVCGWTNNKDRLSVDYDEAMRGLGIDPERLKPYEKSKPGPRVFRFKFKGDK